MESVSIGVDVGQKRDPTAIVVAEVLGQEGQTTFLVRHIESLSLGTPYPKVASRVAEVVRGVRDRMPGTEENRSKGRRSNNIELIVDATGVGQPVVDLIRQELPERACRVRAATFTHGDRLMREGSELRVGKAHLVSRLQALLQTKRLKLPRTRETEALRDELLDYEIRVTEDANDKYGAFRVGTHDDLVTALGLAVLEDHHPPPVVRARFFEWGHSRAPEPG